MELLERVRGAKPRPVALRETRRRISGANPLSGAPRGARWRAHGITRAGPRCKTSACCTPGDSSADQRCESPVQRTPGSSLAGLWNCSSGSEVQNLGLMHSGAARRRISGANPLSSAPRGGRSTAERGENVTETFVSSVFYLHF